MRFWKALLFVTLLARDVCADTPLVVAHRAGSADAPENTIEAIQIALDNGTDLIWLTVQLSRDGVPVLFRPEDLSELTNVSGSVSTFSADELSRLRVNQYYKRDAAQNSWQTQARGIPSLDSALKIVPESVPIILDLKSTAVQGLSNAVAKVLESNHAWSRVSLYSTDLAYQEAFAQYPQSHLFESRDQTRRRFLEKLLTGGCVGKPDSNAWIGFELTRPMRITESYTLGEGETSITVKMLTPETISCARQFGPVKIFAFAINTEESYREALCLGVDAVLTDSPSRIRQIRMTNPTTADCESMS